MVNKVYFTYYGHHQALEDLFHQSSFQDAVLPQLYDGHVAHLAPVSVVKYSKTKSTSGSLGNTKHIEETETGVYRSHLDSSRATM